MMDLEFFLENYSMTGFSPYVVVTDNKEVPIQVNEMDYAIWDIKSKEGQAYLKKYKTQENTFDKYTGYVIVVKSGAKVPIQTCFLTSEEGYVQNVQNLIVLEEDSEAEIFTGCLSNSHVKDNIHNALTDIYVGKNAKLTFNMVHSWGTTSKVLPKTRVFVDEGGTYLSNYIVWDSVKKIVSNPKMYLKNGASAVSRSLVYSHVGSELNLGGNLYLEGEDSSGELISHVVSDGGDFKNFSEIVGEGKDTRGHVECDAVLLGDGSVEAVPTLRALNADTELSHEASVGKIARDEIEYLQTKGLDSDVARELIVRGFVNTSLKNMPDQVKSKMNEILEKAGEGF